MGCLDQSTARIIDYWSAAVGYQRDVMALLESVEQKSNFLIEIPGAVARDSPGNMVVGEQGLSRGRIFRGDKGNGLQRSDRSDGNIVGVANGSADDIEGAGRTRSSRWSIVDVRGLWLTPFSNHRYNSPLND